MITMTRYFSLSQIGLDGEGDFSALGTSDL